MKMARVAVRCLVPRSTVAEIDLARDVGVDHPLERSVDGGASDTRFLPAHDVEQIGEVKLRAAGHADPLDRDVASGGSALELRLAAGPHGDDRPRGRFREQRDVRFVSGKLRRDDAEPDAPGDGGLRQGDGQPSVGEIMRRDEEIVSSPVAQQPVQPGLGFEVEDRRDPGHLAEHHVRELAPSQFGEGAAQQIDGEIA